MSNQFNTIPPMPGETARNARAIFSRGNFYIQVGEHLERILTDILVESLLEESGAILPLSSFFQFLEGLTDVQTIDAVRTRLDWKFALHLPIYPPALHESALCQFRQRVFTEPVCQREFQALVDRLILFNPPVNSRLQEVDILEMLTTVCSVNRLGLIHEEMCQALEALAGRFPAWLRKITLPHWYGRYNHAAPGFDSSASLSQQELMISEIHTDIHHILKEVRRSGLDEIKELQEVKRLDHIWRHQLERSNLILNNKGRFFKWHGCEFCIYKERRNPDDLYQ